MNVCGLAGFGQSATPAFAASATPGFGSPGTPAFGAPASPAAPFGAPASANAFGGGFAAAASQTGKSRFPASEQALRVRLLSLPQHALLPCVGS